MTIPEKADQGAERMRVHLRTFVEASKLDRKTLAERAEMTGPRLSALLADGGPSPGMGEVLAVLHGLDVAPYRFFGDFFGSPTTELETRLMALTEELVESGALNRERLDAATERCRFRGAP